MKYYLISRLSQSYHSHNESVAKLIDDDIYIPHHHTSCDIPHSHIPFKSFKDDLSAMKKSEIGIAVFPSCSDSTAEIGWFHGSKKPVIGIIYDSGYGESAEMQYHKLKDDWRTKGFLTSVIVIGEKNVFYDMVKADPILSDKCCFIENCAEIRTVLQKLIK